MIQHTVVFRLKHAPGSVQEQAFLRKADVLRHIPDVLDFKVLDQISPKNNYTLGFSMYFSTEQTYQAYNDHADHVEFVNTVWLPEVEEFLEIDYVEKHS